ncbi:predicted protein [Chaetomium globosum CBS 148.51]|uniref:MICOS complex subunit MIC12 n=1 Tax=Chaetomium globosum (strain ATCC 6205 / CBS 148.51 / DSM 1962 / NBRC 6347 / NRRL 1970) TaxID=306901 RepID=Q2HGI9_CHAGB|nr:uncharacterized protein CHGG_00665 [Chaetomium globosum CBS 148.51]EAQ92430.1 predicted protein [Chaetomium globosum CBS 148.51]
MGFAAGFAGGVTLTLSLTYLTLLTHSRNRQAQSAVLRSQASTLDLFIPPDIDATLPPAARRRNASAVLPDGTYRPRATLEQHHQQQQRDGSPGASFLEAAKTRWNGEVLAAVRWAQDKDWARARERAEDGVAGLFGVRLSREPVQVEEVVFVPSHAAPQGGLQQQQREQQQQQAATPSGWGLVRRQPQEEAEHHRWSDALHRAGDTTVVVAQAMREERWRLWPRRGRCAPGEGARGAVERGSGVERVHDLVGRTKAAVHLAEERAEAKADAKLLHVSDIEKALAERYDSARREEQLKKSVEETLRERYLPVEKKQSSQWRV